jgi:hypothetical protein
MPELPGSYRRIASADCKPHSSRRSTAFNSHSPTFFSASLAHAHLMLLASAGFSFLVYLSFPWRACFFGCLFTGLSPPCATRGTWFDTAW